MQPSAAASRRGGRILIVDDHPLLREGLAARLARQPDLEVCGEAEDVDSAYHEVRRLQPDLVLVDISLKEGDGLDLIARIAKDFPKVRTLVLSTYGEALYGERAVRAGAWGYLHKQEAREKVVEAVRQVLDGRYFLGPDLQDRLVGIVAQGGTRPDVPPVDRLSNRELEVFRLIGQGLATSAIAERLHVGVKTVETHRQRIKQKLRLATGPQLVHEATRWTLENE